MAAEILLAEYTIGDSLSDLAVYWQADNDSYRDFATGWTFTIEVGNANAVAFTKTTGITGAIGSATVPSITIAWAATGELSTITTPGDYYVQVRCTRTADGKRLTKRGTLRMVT